MGDLDAPFVEIVLFLMSANCFWIVYLNYRQRRKLKETYEEQTATIKKLQTKKEFDEATAYALDRNTYSTYQNLYMTVQACLFITLGTYVWSWEVAGTFADNYLGFL